MKAIKCYAFCADKLKQLLDYRFQTKLHRGEANFANPAELISWNGEFVRPARDTKGYRIWVADRVLGWVEDTSGGGRGCVRQAIDRGIIYGWHFVWEPGDQLLEELFIAEHFPGDL